SGCPPARTLTSMAFDPETNHVVLFGGATSILDTSTVFGDLWEWDTASRTWTEIAPTGPLWPTPRAAPVMSYFATFGGVLIWGGCETGGPNFCRGPDADKPRQPEQVLVGPGGRRAPPRWG